MTYCNMILARTRQGSNAIKKIEELQLNNKKKNDMIRKQQEEEEKQKKDKEEARRIQEEAEKEKEDAITPQNLHENLNGVDSTQTETRAADNDGEEHSPHKMRSGLSKSSTKRTRAPQVTPSKAMTTNQPAPSYLLNPPRFWIPSITHSLVLSLSWPLHSRVKNPLMNILRS